ncbi:MAG: hypothetical protein ACI8PZ_003239 [Myxococcota bacterium]|jgi:hypothetical protein
MMLLSACLGAAMASPILEAVVSQHGVAWVRPDRSVAWVAAPGDPVSELGRAEGRVAMVAVGPGVVSTLGRSGQWVVFAFGAAPQRVEGPSGGGVAVAVADGGRLVLAAGADKVGSTATARDVGPTLGPGTLWVLDRAAGSTTRMGGDGSAITALAADHHGARWVAGFASGLVRTWPDLVDRQVGAPVRAVALDHDRLAAVTDSAVHLFAAEGTMATARAAAEVLGVELSADAVVVHHVTGSVVWSGDGSAAALPASTRPPARACAGQGDATVCVLAGGGLLADGVVHSTDAAGPDPRLPAR